jgi:hypothetical protein
MQSRACISAIRMVIAFVQSALGCTSQDTPVISTHGQLQLAVSMATRKSTSFADTCACVQLLATVCVRFPKITSEIKPSHWVILSTALMILWWSQYYKNYDQESETLIAYIRLDLL